MDENKIELFVLLAQHFVTGNIQPDKILVTTKDTIILSNPEISPIENTSMLFPCSHEEANTRIFLHLAHACMTGHRNAISRTAVTDVVLAVSSTNSISPSCGSHLEQANHSITYMHIKLQFQLVLKNHDHYLFSMPSVVVALYLHLWEKKESAWITWKLLYS